MKPTTSTMDYIDSLKKTIVFILIIIVPLSIITLALSEQDTDNKYLEELREEFSASPLSPVDHSKFAELQVDFQSPHKVTEACLGCHTERGTEILNNAHWNWEREEYIEGRGVTYLGKRNLLNNFCTGILSNEAACNKCHIGYGWTDKSFDFSNQYNIDCLICHDNTGTYEKATGGAGYPPMGESSPDYNRITQSVGSPTKYNCGYCHFFSAGGNNIKHGDLENALLDTDQSVDVHMGKDGVNLSCTECHITENHQMRGMYYGVSSSPRNPAHCTDCHTAYPHLNNKLNEHTLKVDCRACHIPTYAKVNPTKMSWDWSTAGKRKDGLPYATVDSAGNEVYLSEKGDFDWETNAIPDYVWFNGYADHHLPTDKISTDTVNINTLRGSFQDPQAKIIPVKIHTGKQPYDTEHMTLIQAKLWAKEEGQGALWVDLEWEEAIEKGMDYVGMPYSGEYDFIPTRMYLPISHMVSKADDALSCNDCHQKNGSRLKGIEGVYLPAMSDHATLDMIGKIIIIFTILGVFGHASLRIISAIRRKPNNI
ncbi:MAG: tetrathionate reductase family octaheme c-type cytochrome [Bacteroidales bacterium]